MSKHTHKTKDGRTAKKGLYYYMNRAKKRGTSKPGKGTVTDEALARSKKTAKKAMMGGKKEMMYKEGGKFPDMNNDNKISQADIFLRKKETGTIAKKGGAKKKKAMMYKKGGMKQQAAIAINMKKEGKMPKDKMGMGGKKKMMKDGGKKKMGYGGMMKKKKMMGGGTMKKKMMYETGGFLEPGIPNIDDINCC